MGALRNWRHEQGALAFYAGKSDKEAMEAARLKWSPANGRRFRNRPDIKARVAELFQAERPFLVLDALKARREREAIAYARMASYYEDVLDPDGKPTGEVRFKGFAALTDQQIAAIASIKATKLGVEIKLHDKDASLRAIEARVDPVQPAKREPPEDIEDNVPGEQVAQWDDIPAAAMARGH